MRDFPRNLRFDVSTTPGALRVSYVKPPVDVKDEAAVLKDPLDLWGVAWLLHHEGAGQVVDVRPPRGLSRARWRTLILRMEAMGQCFPGIEFRVDGTTRFLQEAAEIRADLKSGLLFTYDRSNFHRAGAGTKGTPESVVEAWIFDHAKKFLHGTFPHGLRRQFPANIFKTSLAEPNRATAKQWIDLIGVDVEGRLSAIELKVGENLPLDLLAQGLDYAVYCHVLRRHLQWNWFPEATSERVALYLVADAFHPGLLPREGDGRPTLAQAMRPTDWLDVIFVQIESGGLPAGLAEKVVFPIEPPPSPAE